MPRSPCKASTVCSTTLVEPVLVSVAAIFWPTLPDLPIPTTTILPRWRSALTTRSTARSNAASSCARTALRPANSMSKTSRARFRWLMRRRGCQRGWRLSMAKPFNRAAGAEQRGHLLRPFPGQHERIPRPHLDQHRPRRITDWHREGILGERPQWTDSRRCYSVFGYEPSTLTKLHCCSSSAMALATLWSLAWPSQSMKKKYSHALRLLGRDSI